MSSGPRAAESFDEGLIERIALAAQRWSPGATVQSSDAVTKGSSGLTYSVLLADGIGQPVPAYVKVAPPGLPPVANRDVLRQAAVIEELHQEGSVPVARVLFEDAGSPPDIPPFFVTAAVTGSCLEPLIDEGPLPAAAVLMARSTNAAQVLARLHRFDPASLRSRDLGNSVEFADLLGEVDRWARVFATLQRRGADAAAGTADIALMRQAESCAERLRASVPQPLTSVVVHGDFRLGNLVCDDSEVRAILDWEIWSLTDPRIDVAWFLMTLSPDGLPSAIRAEAPGLLGSDAAIAVYEEATGAHLTDLNWFAALSRFRSAAAMLLNIKHNRRRPEPNPRIESYAPRLPSFLSIAADFLA